VALKINLGCGNDIKKGYLNVDIVPLKGVDQIVDLNKRFPWKTNSVDEIYCDHVIDHLENPTAVLQECHRVLKKGGKLIVLVPHFTSATAYWGGVRKHQFSWMTFQRYKADNKRAYYFEFYFSKITVDFQFQRSPFWLFWYNYPLRWLANKKPFVYEMTFLRSFPCIQMHITCTK
jgi:predicted SAM-dependent methyltransferase